MDRMLQVTGADADWTTAAEISGELADATTPVAANGCDMPCPDCSYYNTCTGPGPHDGAHHCDQGHRW